MYDYNLLEDRDVLCIDQKFFASVSCMEKGLDPLTTKLAVASRYEKARFGRSSNSKVKKELGIKTGSRLLRYHIVMTFILLIKYEKVFKCICCNFKDCTAVRST